MAAACAATLRMFDGTRPIQLVADRSAEVLASSDYSARFDHVAPVTGEVATAGPIAKLHAFEHAMFDETMFVDADCLLLKRDIGIYWSRLSKGYDLILPGLWQDRGDWYGMAIADMCRLAGIDRLVQMNSGAFFFKRTAAAKTVFDTARALLNRLANFTAHVYRGTGAPDEPFFALAMGILGVEPFPTRDDHCDSWMTATMNSLEVHADATSGRPQLVRRHRKLSPSLCHFTSLFPREIYDWVARDLLAAARARGLTPPPRADRPVPDSSACGGVPTAPSR